MGYMQLPEYIELAYADIVRLVLEECDRRFDTDVYTTEYHILVLWFHSDVESSTSLRFLFWRPSGRCFIANPTLRRDIVLKVLDLNMVQTDYIELNGFARNVENVEWHRYSLSTGHLSREPVSNKSPQLPLARGWRRSDPARAEEAAAAARRMLGEQDD